MELAMLIGAKGFTMTDDAFASRKMHAAMGAAHHILASFRFCCVLLPDPAAIALDEAVNNPCAQSKKYQFDQHHSASVNEAPQG
ncbi:MAG: hypothetical protein KJ958_00400 [Gammaproteobacteria bacterium]|nr:hypothetical protein [Gammaproteobacteria bacterium]